MDYGLLVIILKNRFLQGEDLSGILPPALVKLPYLKLISLSRNYLSGNIPREWASMQLEHMSFTVNNLSGPIPSFLGNITTLQYLSIENNLFSGTIPPELGNLVNLEILSVFLSRLLFEFHITFDETLLRQLPTALTRLNKLREFRISSNYFTRKIPDFFQSWTQLETLEIEGSGLKGPIPSSMSVLKNLIELRISDLEGEGSLFPPLMNMTKMMQLTLSSCNISGEIPSYISKMTNLRILDLSFNRLKKEIQELESPVNLMNMYLTSNLLTGVIPNWMRNCERNIDLSYNNLTWSSEDTCTGTKLNLFKSFNGQKNSVCPEDDRCPKDNIHLHISLNIIIRKMLQFCWIFFSIISMEEKCLANGKYTVRLHFAEIVFRGNKSFYSLGRRIFDVYIQEAKGVDRAVIINIKAVPVTNKSIDIRFHWAGKGTTAAPRKGTYGPLISAISVEFSKHSSAERLFGRQDFKSKRDESDVKSLGGDFVTNKVKVDFNVLGAGMKGRVGSEVCGANVITPKGGRCGKKNAKFAEHGLEPYELGSGGCESTIFGFGAGSSNSNYIHCGGGRNESPGAIVEEGIKLNVHSITPGGVLGRLGVAGMGDAEAGEVTGTCKESEEELVLVRAGRANRRLLIFGNWKLKSSDDMTNNAISRVAEASVPIHEVGTIAHLDFIGSIIRFRVEIQIVEVGSDMVSGTGVRIPVEIPGLGLSSSVGRGPGPKREGAHVKMRNCERKAEYFHAPLFCIAQMSLGQNGAAHMAEQIVHGERFNPGSQGRDEGVVFGTQSGKERRGEFIIAEFVTGGSKGGGGLLEPLKICCDGGIALLCSSNFVVKRHDSVKLLNLVLWTELKNLDLQTGFFTFKHIRAATNNFDVAHKIGQGGFGSVYKGILVDGTIIAVKQLSSESNQGNREFVNEMGTISALQHPNLVRLYGCCIEKNQLFLVYEYMENNSLARALFGPEEYRLKLDWPTRQKICVGIARGLTFLHEESTLRIVHRDIKTSNVLLDRDLNPKISDFGLAKLHEEENTHISTRIAGTMRGIW
ncbi:probable LRR receptor-like serine/threonine-protein kinase At1g53420 [Corylus avellana]|uniref:probable LRR receptor-like serine/threonine-protein kinase At1g53420 n=1 Tax=Corylus avellana TaxID=13451 RepID=UPI00286BE4D6|nr:probable LRR receptor-like serine/threonine-protein kinase At1g53420 [Corylus avellana]